MTIVESSLEEREGERERERERYTIRTKEMEQNGESRHARSEAQKSG